MIAVESLLFLLGGIVLAVVLIQVFGRGGEIAGGRPKAKLVRRTVASDGHEETRLMINDQPILVASSKGVRLADYADEVERLESIATHIASALGIRVELERTAASGQPEEGAPVRELPPDRREPS